MDVTHPTKLLRSHDEKRGDTSSPVPLNSEKRPNPLEERLALDFLLIHLFRPPLLWPLSLNQLGLDLQLAVDVV
jgi:hypothetical protein